MDKTWILLVQRCTNVDTFQLSKPELLGKEWSNMPGTFVGHFFFISQGFGFWLEEFGKRYIRRFWFLVWGVLRLTVFVCVYVTYTKKIRIRAQFHDIFETVWLGTASARHKEAIIGISQKQFSLDFGWKKWFMRLYVVLFDFFFLFVKMSAIRKNC